jgi:hypothetical protein
MKRFWRDNGLSLVVFGLFLAFLLGQIASGHRVFNDGRAAHGEPPVQLAGYLQSGAFLEATMENWESEFLQMAAFVLLTVYLRQRGSAESKSMEGDEAVDRDPRLSRNKEGVPWPVRKGGLVLRVYEYSLTLAFALLFALSFTLHAVGGMREHNAEQQRHGEPVVSFWEYLRDAQFWFESFQNWQSEFLALGAMAVLSVYLRQRGSPESKPVDAPHCATGKD